MCVCEFHRETGQAGPLSGSNPWFGDAWDDEEWHNWLWHGWFPVQSIWSLNRTPFACQICNTSIDDYVVVIGHEKLQDLHEYSQLGVCFSCYEQVYSRWGIKEPCLAPNYEALQDLCSVTRERAYELTDAACWSFFPDYQLQDAIATALGEMRVRQEKYRRYPSQQTYSQLLLSETALERLDEQCSNAFWTSSAEYGYGTLYMRVSQKASVQGPRFVSSYSTEENDPHNDAERYVYRSQSGARKKCVEEVLRLSFRFIETSIQSIIGQTIT